MRRRFGVTTLLGCRTSIGFDSMAYDNLHADLWFGKLLARYPETRDRVVDVWMRECGNRRRIL
jgi:hypothetical protein